MFVSIESQQETNHFHDFPDWSRDEIGGETIDEEIKG